MDDVDTNVLLLVKDKNEVGASRLHCSLYCLLEAGLFNQFVANWQVQFVLDFLTGHRQSLRITAVRSNRSKTKPLYRVTYERCCSLTFLCLSETWLGILKRCQWVFIIVCILFLLSDLSLIFFLHTCCFSRAQIHGSPAHLDSALWILCQSSSWVDSHV